MRQNCISRQIPHATCGEAEERQSFDVYRFTKASARHKDKYMHDWMKFLHLGSAILWMGGMGFVLLSLRPVAIALMAPPERVALLSGVLSRFFAIVWITIALLLVSGFWMLSAADMKLAPKGWHAMSGLGILMCLVFAHIWFAPFRRLKTAVKNADLAMAGKSLSQIHPMVVTNFALGWLAILAVLVWR